MVKKRGRPTLIEEREIREKLQKFLPDIYAFYEEVFKYGGRELKEKISKEILDKLIAGRKAMELTGENNGPIEIKIVEDKRNNNNE